MTTYTLDEIVHLNTFVTGDRRRFFDVLNSSVEDIDAKVAIGGSEKTRAGDVVGLWHGYGGDQAYGPSIHAFFAAILSNSVISASSNKRYTLGELSWFEFVGMFWGDMKRELVERGTSEEVAEALSQACKHAGGNVGLWWMLISQEHRSVAEDYITHEIANYTPDWPHNDKTPSPSTDMAM